MYHSPYIMLTDIFFYMKISFFTVVIIQDEVQPVEVIHSLILNICLWIYQIQSFGIPTLTKHTIFGKHNKEGNDGSHSYRSF